ncbi:MAG: glycosyltransferase family 2 protein [Cyclobacteriaceae bacterium]|nr:glycosyltransferase family 2 protein [Cyclobacteriaceae bacterium]
MNKKKPPILNYNGENFLRQFLPSVITYSQDAEVIVIDNGSTDNSLTIVKNEFPSVTLIALDKNYGFCGGYNRGISKIDKDWVVLLNSDVEVTKGWLQNMLDVMNADEHLAALQPKILSYQHKNRFDYAGAAGGYIDIFGYPYCRGRIFDFLENDNNQYNTATDCFWAGGACILVNKKIYIESGGLDEDFFAHMEEIDLCWRLKRSEYTIGIAAASVVYHVGGGTLSKINPQKTYLNFRNGLELLLKNLSLLELIWIVPIRIGLDWVAAIRFLLSKQDNHAWAIAKAHLHFIKRLNKTISKRRAIKLPYLPLSARKPISIVLAFYIQSKKKFSDLRI